MTAVIEIKAFFEIFILILYIYLVFIILKTHFSKTTFHTQQKKQKLALPYENLLMLRRQTSLGKAQEEN